ncbi:hypothetical protein GGE12_005416 [Rhizobium mongolense]|uniref:Phage integrase family protein n=1 Tax=Rhizobium mongolense TaxID=57676 RepID=A0A7W6RSG5_9HYPH|nr:hypothetical protein [Rhizobium mongolense]
MPLPGRKIKLLENEPLHSHAYRRSLRIVAIPVTAAVFETAQRSWSTCEANSAYSSHRSSLIAQAPIDCRDSPRQMGWIRRLRMRTSFGTCTAASSAPTECRRYYKYVAKARTAPPFARSGYLPMSCGTPAMELLQAGVDCSIIALWLGHETMETTLTYLHAHLELKESDRHMQNERR